MHPAFELMRPSVCLMTVIALVVGSLVIGFPLSFTLLIAVVAAFLLCGSGNVINDYRDYKIDKISMPHRPIPSGRITRSAALGVFVVTAVAGLILAALVSVPYFAIALFNFLVLAAYAHGLKRLVLIKNIAVAWLAASSFLAAGFLGVSIAVGTALLLLVGISFLAALSREILKDIRDVKGDAAAQIRTLPAVIGERATRWLAFAILLLAAATLVVPFALGIFSVWYWLGAVPAVVVILYAMTKNIRTSEKLVKVASYLVLIGFLLGSLL